MATQLSSLRSAIAIVAIGFVPMGLVAACNSTDPFQGIELRTEVSPAVVAVGDTVTFRAIMRNRTSDDVDPGSACGPPLLFELRDASNAVIHPIPLDIGFTCELADYHRLEPHETDSVVRRWRVDLSLGEWSVRSGFRSGAGLTRLSPAVTLMVQ
jgi:hypothetical protein